MLARKNDKKMTEELRRYMKSDLGRNPQGKVKGGCCVGCEVCWLEPPGFRFKPPKAKHRRWR